MSIAGVLLMIGGLLMLCGAVLNWGGIFRDHRVSGPTTPTGA